MIYPSIVPLLASAVRTANTTIDPQTFTNPHINPLAADAPPISCGSILAYLNITAVPGADTVLLKLQEKIPASGAWVDVPGAATLAQVGAATVKLIVGPSIATVAATALICALQQQVPPFFRFVVVHSGAGNFTYSLDLCLDMAL